MQKSSVLKISTSAIGISLTLASQCFAQQASAQGVPSVSDSGDLGDIVATAQKREQSIQRVPVTITTITGESLAMRGTSNIEDLGLTVPGVQIGMATGVIQPFLRGEGNTSTTIGNDSSVAVYVDGICYSRLPVDVFQTEKRGAS